MKNNRGYIAIIIVLLGVIFFLTVLLFISDTGKYCVPIIKEQHSMPVKLLNKDSLAGAGSSGGNYYQKDTAK